MNEEKYNLIANKIINHIDYGKCNPVDIGTECGYDRDEMDKFIKYLKEKKNDEEPDYVYMDFEGSVYEVCLRDYSLKN